MDREKVIKGMEQFRADLKPFCGNHADWERFDAGLSMLKEQEAVVRCKDCDNKECDGRAGTIVCGITGESHSRFWFCADGERKEKTNCSENPNGSQEGR